MNQKLRPEEIDKLLAKIRERYIEYGQRMGERFFNLQAFNARYAEALRKRIDMQTFLYAEVMALEDRKRQCEEKEREIRIRTDKTFTRKIELMLEGMADRIRSYPELYTQEGLPFEARHLCGALDLFHERDWLTVGMMVDQYNLKDLRMYNLLSAEIGRFTLAPKGKLPYEVETFLLNIRRHGEEKALLLLLKEGAKLIGKCVKFLSAMDLGDAEKRLRIECGSGAIYDGKTRAEVSALVRQQLDQIVRDFRFTDLV
jgi:hypothetical protein